MTMYTVSLNGENYDLLNAESGEILTSCDRLDPHKLLEFVGGKLEKVFDEFDVRIDDDIRDAFVNARYKFMEDFPDRDCPPFTVRKDTEYVYLYSSITNPDRVGGITKRKYADLLRAKIFKAIARQTDDGIGWLTLHIQKIEECGMKSWLTMGYIPMNMSDFTENWLRTNGVMLKPGKAVRKMTDDNADISIFAGYFQDEMNKLNPDQCEILVSDTPSDIYVMGGDFTSCMRKDDPEFFRIYDDVESCSIAYIVEDGKLRARALLWETVEDMDTGETYNVMDRIYSENHKYLSAMILWATTHGYLHKTAQALNIDTYYKPDLSVVTLKNARVGTSFPFKHEMYVLVPYVDTFQWVFNGKHDMYTTDRYGYGACLTDTDGNGGWLTRPHSRCINCDDIVDEDTAFYDNDGEAWCEHCFDNNWTRCENCDEWVRNNEIYEVSINGDPKIYVCRECLDPYWYEDWSDSYWNAEHSHRAIDKNGEDLWISEERFEDEGVWFECAECRTIRHEVWLDHEMHETCKACANRIREEKEEAI